jgi:hypothetical protein
MTQLGAGALADSDIALSLNDLALVADEYEAGARLTPLSFWLDRPVSGAQPVRRKNSARGRRRGVGISAG